MDCLVMPSPTQQRGEVIELAIATPGMINAVFLRVSSNVAAIPPNTAITTSRKVGEVLAIDFNGVIGMGSNVKYSIEVIMHKRTSNKKSIR